jgi:hypothetical protein
MYVKLADAGKQQIHGVPPRQNRKLRKPSMKIKTIEIPQPIDGTYRQFASELPLPFINISPTS